MKSKIKLLVVGFVLSCILGLVGCTNVSMGTGIKLSSEATHSVVKTVNDRDVILARHDNYQVVYNFQDGDMKGFSAEYLYYYDANGNQGVDYLLSDANGEMVAATSIVDGLKYSIDNTGNKTLTIHPESNFNDEAAKFGFSNFDVQTLDGEVEFHGDTLVLLTKEVIGEGEEQQTASYRYVVDYESFLLTSAVYTLTATDGSVIEKADISFGYGIDKEESAVSPYDQIFSDSEDAIFFTLILNPGENSSALKFSVTEGTDVAVADSLTDGSYTLYKNYDCTKDIVDSSEYLSYYNGAKIYACPTKEQFSFDFTLTEEDVEHMEYLIETFTTLGSGTAFWEDAEDARIMMEDRMGYFVHQYYMGQVKYYLDITKQEGKDAFTFAEESYHNAYNAYIDAYREVYESESEYSEWLFADWTEEDLAILYEDNEAITECESINSQLEQEYNDLNPNSATWSQDVDAIFERLVANNQRLAALNGYDNAYEYYSVEVFGRVYTAEERANLSSLIKKYALNFTNTAIAMYREYATTLNNSDKGKYSDLMYNNLRSKDNEYIGGYINSYSNGLEVKMSRLYDEKLAKFANSNSSMGTAYANYSSYYEEGFTFFGREYQEIFTIIHEMGHYISFNSYSLSDMGYDLAETHSQANEWMFLSYLNGKIDKDVHNVIRTYNLANSMNAVFLGMLVDEFEYRVYTAETPYTASQYRGLMEEILLEFGIMNETQSYYDGYVQRVVVLSPIYYLNYVTSGLASMGFYLVAEEQGYETAQEVYRKLQEDVDLSMTYSEILADIGCYSPFEKETFLLIKDVFGL